MRLAECAGPLGRIIGGVRRDKKINKLELEYELELKIQHAARGTADSTAPRIPPDLSQVDATMEDVR